MKQKNYHLQNYQIHDPYSNYQSDRDHQSLENYRYQKGVSIRKPSTINGGSQHSAHYGQNTGGYRNVSSIRSQIEDVLQLCRNQNQATGNQLGQIVSAEKQIYDLLGKNQQIQDTLAGIPSQSQRMQTFGRNDNLLHEKKQQQPHYSSVHQEIQPHFSQVEQRGNYTSTQLRKPSEPYIREYNQPSNQGFKNTRNYAPITQYQTNPVYGQHGYPVDRNSGGYGAGYVDRRDIEKYRDGDRFYEQTKNPNERYHENRPQYQEISNQKYHENRPQYQGDGKFEQNRQGSIRNLLKQRGNVILDDQIIRMIEDIENKAIREIQALQADKIQLMRRLNEEISNCNNEKKKNIELQSELIMLRESKPQREYYSQNIDENEHNQLFRLRIQNEQFRNQLRGGPTTQNQNHLRDKIAELQMELEKQRYNSEQWRNKAQQGGNLDLQALFKQGQMIRQQTLRLLKIKVEQQGQQGGIRELGQQNKKLKQNQHRHNYSSEMTFSPKRITNENPKNYEQVIRQMKQITGY